MTTAAPRVLRVDLVDVLATQVLLGVTLGREAREKLTLLAQPDPEILVISLLKAMCVDYRFVGEAIGSITEAPAARPAPVVEIVPEYHRLNVLEGIVWKSEHGYRNRSPVELEEMLRSSARRVVLRERTPTGFALSYVGATEQETELVSVVERYSERTVGECARELQRPIDQTGEALLALARKGFIYRKSPQAGGVETRFLALTTLLEANDVASR